MFGLELNPWFTRLLCTRDCTASNSVIVFGVFLECCWVCPEMAREGEEKRNRQWETQVGGNGTLVLYGWIAVPSNTNDFHLVFFFSPSPDNIAEVEVTVEMDDASQSIHRKSAKSKQQRKLWVALQNGSYLFSSHALTVQWFTSRRVVWLTYAHTVFLYCSLD